MRWKAALVALALLPAGCGKSTSAPSNAAGNSTPAYTYAPSAAKVPACTKAGKAIPLPKKFPHQFPFPRGTLIESTKPLILKQQIGIYGYVPSKGFAPTVTFFKTQVPKHGFKRLDFEVDEPNDSEGVYRGFGTIGRWKLASIPGCKGAMRFSASAQPISASKG